MNIENKIKKITDFIFSLDFCVKIINQIENNEHLPIFKIKNSLMISNGINVLSCEHENLEFFIFQSVSSSDFIYFPDLNIFKLYCHTNQEMAKVLVDKYLNFISCSPTFNKNRYQEFGGIIASHGRPGHFFYDTAIGLQLLHEEGYFSKPQKVYQIKGSDFINLENLYSDSGLLKSKSINYTELNNISDEDGLFFFKVGRCSGIVNEVKKEILDRFDKGFKKYSNKISFCLKNEICDYKKQGYFVLWHGITTEKRCWYEQEEAIIFLVNKLVSLSYKVVLIIDGWTSPVNKTHHDLVNIDNDNKIFEKIKIKFKEDIKCLSIIGEIAEKKLAIVDLIDFHISNGGTGSLYTSRIAKKNGLLHMSNVFSDICNKVNIHHNSFYMPSALVEDVASLNSQRSDFVSYSIKPKYICDAVMSCLLPSSVSSVYIYKIVNCEKISSLKAVYKSLSNDPIILLDFFKDKPLAGDELIFDFEIERETSAKERSANFYFDYGKGFSAEHVLSLKYVENRLSGSFVLPYNLKALRFDPISSIGEFFINKINLRVIRN